MAECLQAFSATCNTILIVMCKCVIGGITVERSPPPCLERQNE